MEEIRRAAERYSDLLLRLALSRTGCAADAEDVVQEAFLRMLTRAPRFRDGEHEKAWLIRTTVNLAHDLRRAARKRDVSLDDEALAGAEAPRPSPLLSAVRALPDKYGTVIHLHYYEGYSIKEIGDLLGLPAATVGTRLARGRERLKILLEEDVI